MIYKALPENIEQTLLHTGGEHMCFVREPVVYFMLKTMVISHE
jgi:hypothetical protein